MRPVLCGLCDQEGCRGKVKGPHGAAHEEDAVMHLHFLCVNVFFDSKAYARIQNAFFTQRKNTSAGQGLAKKRIPLALT
jgi:hypothetical protein